MPSKKAKKAKPDQMSLRRHRISGKPGHNRDLMQTARELNAATEREKKIKEERREKAYGSISELMKKEK